MFSFNALFTLAVTYHLHTRITPKVDINNSRINIYIKNAVCAAATIQLDNSGQQNRGIKTPKN